MTVHHEDRVFWGVLTAATAIGLLLTIAVLATPWTIAGKSFALAFVALAWFGVTIPLYIFYLEERDKRLLEEQERKEQQEKRRLERALAETAASTET